MDEQTLRLQVRTPEGLALDEPVTSLRVPSDTGQVGLRPRSEPAALVVEPGLALAATADGLRFVATAGGLLRCDGQDVVLLTPLAVVGDDAGAVRERLSEVLGRPSPDLELRSILQRLETGILEELHRGRGSAAAKIGGPGV